MDNSWFCLLLVKYLSLRVRDFSIYHDYIRWNKAIAIERSPKSLLTFRIFIGFYLLWVLDLFYLAASSDLTESQRVLHYDVGYFLSGRFQVNYGATALMGHHLYAAYMLYTIPLERNNQLLQKIISNDIGKADEESWWFLASLNLFYDGGLKLLCNDVKRYFVRTITGMLLVYRLIIECLILFMNVFMARKYIQLASAEFPLYQAPTLCVICLVSSIIFDLWALSYSHITIQLVSIGIVQLHVIKLKLSLIYKYLRKSQRNLFISAYFYKYRSESVHLLEYITEYNRLYGRIFFGYLLAHCPLNAYFVIEIIQGHFTTWGTCFISLFVGFEVFAIFIVHYHFAQFTSEYHKPSLLLLSIAAKRSQQLVSVKTKLCFLNYIGVMHTANRYGITYGNVYGLVTVETFSKFLYLYIVCLLLIHNLFKMSK